MTRNIRLYINDIIECIDSIAEFTKGMSYPDFFSDDRTRSAVVRKIEIIGEATKSIPASIRERCPQIPWKEMAQMRDKTAHAYFGVDYEIVWLVIKERLPEIRPILKALCKEIKDE